MQKPFLVLLYILLPVSLFAAILPSKGYESPYQAESMNYGYLSMSKKSSGGFQIAEEPQVDEEKLATYTCSDEGEPMDFRYCPDCVSESELNAMNCSDIFNYLEYDSDYQTCLYNSCGLHLGQPEMPIGTETPLYIFAFSYLIIQIYNHKKKKKKGN